MLFFAVAIVTIAAVAATATIVAIVINHYRMNFLNKHSY